MSKFIVRSMTTTDFDVVRGIQAVPYHIYLTANRTSAYWGSRYDAMQFDTVEAAQAEIDRSFSATAKEGWARYHNAPEIVPLDPQAEADLPTYWERQRARSEARRRMQERLAADYIPLQSLKPYPRAHERAPRTTIGRAYPLIRR